MISRELPAISPLYVLVGSTPAVDTDATLAVPAGFSMLVLGVTVTLTTGPLVAQRRVALTFADSLGNLILVDRSGTVQAASTTVVYAWGETGGESGGNPTVAGRQILSLPMLPVPAAVSITADKVGGAGSTDQLSAIVAYGVLKPIATV